MVSVVLFDLDDTLLANDMATFLPAYFERLERYATARFEPRQVIEAIRRGTAAMINDTDPARSNRQVFWETFEAQLGERRTLLEPFFDKFYATEFPHLKVLTAPIPGAARVVEWFRATGCRVVLATNPVFPSSAIEQRIRWAGLEPGMFDLITSYENMHATKPSVRYYEEILTRMGCAPDQALMVGNDWGNDIVPALSLGMKTFFVVTGGDEYDEVNQQGSLDRWSEVLVVSGYRSE